MQNYVKLNNGISIPQLGIGVYGLDDEQATETCLKALEIGYRRIDTAHIYNNERGVGKALRLTNVRREDITVTTKLWPSEYGKGKTMKAIDQCMERLGVSYIDVVLLHQQTGDYVNAWKDMELAVKQGKVRAIGVSNFESDKRWNKLIACAEIMPCINQLECHPFRQQHKLAKRSECTGTYLESWFPLGHGYKNLIDNDVFTQLGRKYNKSNVQIIIRWHLQEGYLVIPKTTNPDHLKANFDVFDFQLTDEDMQLIHTLDGTKTFNTMPLCLQGLFNWWQSVTILKK